MGGGGGETEEGRKRCDLPKNNIKWNLTQNTFMTILTMRSINPICNLKQNCQNFKISPVLMFNELKHLMILLFFLFVFLLSYCYSLRMSFAWTILVIQYCEVQY